MVRNPGGASSPSQADLDVWHLVRGTELDGVFQEGLEQPLELRGIARNLRQRLGDKLDACLPEDRGEIPQRRFEDRIEVEDLERPGARRKAGVVQQVLDQDLHPWGAIHGDRAELAPVLFQPLPVALCEKLRVAGYHPQRFLEIMGDRVGELPQS